MCGPLMLAASANKLMLNSNNKNFDWKLWKTIKCVRGYKGLGGATCQFNSVIKSTISHSLNTQCISFLDLNIHLTGSTLSVSPYYKVFDKFLYLPFPTFHTRATKLGFIKAECIRLAISSTALADFHRATASFALHLKMRGYPVYFIETSFAKVKHSDDSSTLGLF